MKRLLFAGLFFCLSMTANAAVMTIGSVIDNGGGSYTISTGTGSVSEASVETFLGLSAGTLDGLATGLGGATEGSAIKDSLTITAGQTFSFDWLWSSDEGPGAIFNDFAFYSLSLDGVGILADTFTPDGTLSSFSWLATSSGTLTYGVGVMDSGDTLTDSFLTASNVNVMSVPEPSSIALLGLGLVGFAFTRRKKSV